MVDAVGLARCEIVETTTRFGWLVDRGHWEDLERLFSPQVEIDYTSLHGGEPYWGPARPQLDEWRTAWQRADAVQQLISSQLVTIPSAGYAVCTANYIATVVSSNTSRRSIWNVGGTYRFELIHDVGTWLISRILMQVLWQTGRPPS
jgi:hypothetical protein